jgi:hypothetical protein
MTPGMYDSAPVSRLLSRPRELTTLRAMSKRPGADRIVRSRFRETLHFPDLTERVTMRLAAVSRYTGRSHFAPWTRILAGVHDHASQGGIVTPLVYVEVETTDAVCDPQSRIEARGESWLARSLDETGAIRHLAREGRHSVLDSHGKLLGVARMVNVFTRYDPDPARRRILELPPELGLGATPSRTIEIPTVNSMADFSRKPDFEDAETHVWHYGQTDPNRHVHGMTYLRMMEEFVADSLYRAGHDLRLLYFARARIAYRKPNFRGEGYRRAAWIRSEAPLTLTGLFFKDNDPPDAVAATVVELTLQQHSPS